MFSKQPRNQTQFSKQTRNWTQFSGQTRKYALFGKQTIITHSLANKQEIRHSLANKVGRAGEQSIENRSDAPDPTFCQHHHSPTLYVVYTTHGTVVNCKNTKQPDLLSYTLAGFFEYLFMFWLHRYLPAKLALNSIQSAKGV